VARPRLHDDDLAVRLLEVASVVISSSGPNGLTVRDVAERAGTSASAVYALFGSRDGLVTAVGQEASARFAAVLASVPTTPDPAADLLALGMAYRASALAEPHFYRVMFDVPTTEPDEPVTKRPTFLVLRDAVVRLLVGSGVPAERSAAAATGPALTLWALAHGLVGLELLGLLPGDEQERADRYARALQAAGPAVVGADWST
jgi:AcrR family transcriptional regulator